MALTLLQPFNLDNTGSYTFSQVTVSGNISAGNITATHYGSGAGLTLLTGANVTGTVANATLADTATTAGTVTANAQANITSVGILTSLSVTGNITGSYFIGNGSQLTGIAAGGIKWTTAANTTPASPSPGDFWYDSYTDTKYQYINDGTSNVWVDQGFPTSFSTLAVTGNITGGNLSVSTGTISVGNIVNTNGNGVGNIGASTLYFNTAFVKATSAQYADLAEMYVSDQAYSPGTLVDFGGEYEISQTTQSHSTRVAGIISTDPSYIMNAGQTGDFVLPVALTGKVPCQVTGKIRKGDRLVASHVPGVATALDLDQHAPGCIIGKSLQDHDGDSVTLIQIAVGRY